MKSTKATAVATERRADTASSGAPRRRRAAANDGAAPESGQRLKAAKPYPGYVAGTVGAREAEELEDIREMLGLNPDDMVTSHGDVLDAIGKLQEAAKPARAPAAFPEVPHGKYLDEKPARTNDDRHAERMIARRTGVMGFDKLHSHSIGELLSRMFHYGDESGNLGAGMLESIAHQLSTLVDAVESDDGVTPEYLAMVLRKLESFAENGAELATRLDRAIHANEQARAKTP